MNDFVIAEYTQAPSAVWYQRNADGWTKHVIDDSQVPIEAGGAFHDVDADGETDIVFGGLGSNEMWWWENPAPNFDPTTPWTRRTIKNTGATRFLHDQQFGDVDGDGVTELVCWDQGDQVLLVLEIPADPRNHAGEWDRAVIDSGTGKSEGLVIADVDGDGTDDIVGGGSWYKHVAGTSPADWQFQEFVIDGDPGREFTRTAVGQLIPGGRPEVVIVPGDADGPLKWYEWNGSTWDQHELVNNVIHGHSLAVEDINGDGHLDVFNAEMGDPGDGVNADSYIFYGDSTGNFVQQTVSVGLANHESKIGDLDGDGDLDILTKPFHFGAPRIDVFLNNGTTYALDLWQRHEIDADLPARTVFVGSGDLDGDTYPDVVSGAWQYQNPLLLDNPWTRTPIGSPLSEYAAIFDFDGDGDLDLFGTQGSGASSNNDLAWARNDGGTWTVFDNIQTVGSGDFLQGVVVDRFGPNGTGPLQIALSWHNGGGGIQLVTVGANPSVDVWTSQIVTPTTQSEQLSSGDVDGDDDADLLLGTQWLRNDGAGTWTPFTLNPTAGAPDRNRLADVDGDGRLDAVVGFEAISTSGKLAWYEQPPGDPTGTWTEHVIDTLIGPMSVDVRDMDGDGDLDVVVGEHNLSNPTAAGIFVYENVDGEGTSWQQHQIHIGDEHHDGAHVTDIDLDGDFDVVSIGWNNDKVVLYENRAIVANGPTVNAPTVTPGGGIYADSVEVTLGTDTPGASLYYTLDGSLPTESSTPYTAPFTLTDSALLKVRGFLSGYDPSPITTADFTVLPNDGERVSEDLLVLYEFAEGSGNTVTDTSGVGSPLNLTIGDVGNVTWANEVLTVDAATLIRSGGPAGKIATAVTASGAITIEAWIVPANTTQNGPARIVTMSADPYARNFTLGQGVYNSTANRYEARLRTTTAGNNGSSPATRSPAGTLSTQLQHVVYTRDAAGVAKINVDGIEVGTATISGDLSNWNNGYEFALANELTGGRPWLGTLDLVAIYGDALTPSEVAQNFVSGPVIGTAPAALDVSIAPDSIGENGGAATGTVTRNTAEPSLAHSETAPIPKPMDRLFVVPVPAFTTFDHPSMLFSIGKSPLKGGR